MQYPATPQEAALPTAMDALRQRVQALIDGDMVLPADGRSLLEIVDVARAALTAGEAPAARAGAEEFMERVQALMTAGLIEPSEARLQTEAAAAIVAVLSG